jgi:hypothetical protein
MDSEEKASYIRASTGKLLVVFGRKENPNLIDVFERVLSRFSLPVIKQAFLRAEESFERFPTPRSMAELCVECTPRPTDSEYRENKFFRAKVPIIDLNREIVFETFPKEEYYKLDPLDPADNKKIFDLFVAANRERYRRARRDHA